MASLLQPVVIYSLGKCTQGISALGMHGEGERNAGWSLCTPTSQILISVNDVDSLTQN